MPFARCGGTREVGSTVAESLVAFYRVGTHQHQLRRRRRAARSSTNQGRADSCARESKARTGRFLREKLVSDYVFFSSNEGLQRAANRQGSCVFFPGSTRLWTAGCWRARRLHQLKVSTIMDLGISIFLIFARCVALKNVDLLIKTDWSVICPLRC